MNIDIKEENNIIYTFSVDSETDEKLCELSARYGVSVNSLLNLAVLQLMIGLTD